MARTEAARAEVVRVSAWQVLTAVVLLVLGFVVVVQMRSGREIARAPEVQTRNVFALATQLQTERAARQALDAEVAALRKQLEDIERDRSEGRAASEAMQRELDTLRLVAGLRPVRGHGVVVEVAEPPVRKAGAPVAVQYTDLVDVINELWAAGAEAVALNDVRLTAITGVSQVGPTMIVGLRRVEPPFRIAAIGDPATLESALQIRGGLIEGLRALGLVVKITRANSLTLPGASAPPQFEHATPVP